MCSKCVAVISELNLSNKNTPAETRVAEWISDEAGTGASIESGSHK